MTLSGPPESFRMGTHWESDQVIRGLELPASKLFINGQWFTHSCLWNGTSIKTLNNRVHRASRLVNTWRSWEGGAPREDREALYPFSSYLALGISSIWLFPSCILCNKLVIVIKLFSCLLYAILTNYWNRRRGCGDPLIYCRDPLYIRLIYILWKQHKLIRENLEYTEK